MAESPDDNLTPEARLLEEAAIDALCLLDVEDAALFDRDFHAAPEALRGRILASQASYAGSPAFGSLDEPLPERRDQVVNAVMAEVRRSVEELAPLAIIGRDVPTLTRRSVFMPATLWRAASLALAAGLVTSLVFVSQALESNRRLRHELEGAIWEVPLREFSDQRVATLTARVHRSLHAVSDEYAHCTAALSLDFDRGTVAVYGFGLRGGSFRVQMLDGETLLREAPLRFSPHGISGTMLTCAAEHLPLLPTATIRIVDGAGNVVLA